MIQGDSIAVPGTTLFIWRPPVKSSPEVPRFIPIGFQTSKSPSRTGGRIRRLPSCRVVKPHQWTRLFAVGGDS